jgi:X-X-X-Leu-X-X-Gly heptad repeat protein
LNQLEAKANQLEAKANQLEAKANQLEAKVKALTEENEKLKTELATGSAGNGQQHGNFSRRINDTKCRSTEARNSTPAIEYHSRIYQQETRG